jgi:hypothetical protein
VYSLRDSVVVVALAAEVSETPSGKKRAGNSVAVGIAPSNHRTYMPALAFKDYVVTSVEPAIFARCPIIASWAPQPRKRPPPKFANAPSS